LAKANRDETLPWSLVRPEGEVWICLRAQEAFSGFVVSCWLFTGCLRRSLV